MSRAWNNSHYSVLDRMVVAALIGLAICSSLFGCAGGEASLPTSVTLRLNVGESRDLSTYVGASITDYQWSVLESGGGAVTQSGFYTAPATVGVYHARAVKLSDQTTQTEFTLIVQSPGSVDVGVTFPATGDLPVTIRSSKTK